MPFGCCPCCKKPKDDQFETYVRIIMSLMTTLRRPEDKICVQKILSHCTELNDAKKPEVRRYNNAFLAYFIKVLHTTASTQPLEIYDEWYHNNHSPQGATNGWLEDNKSYFAMEKTPGGCVIFYSAVAINPKAGWDHGGLRKAIENYEEGKMKTKSNIK